MTTENHTMTTNNRILYFTSRQGFTLIEAMMAVVVLGIAAASLLLPFISGATVRAEGVNRTLAAQLASDLMEQIVNTPFDQIVGSYNGYSDSAYANFSRDVTCEYVYVPPQPDESDPSKCEFIRITICVDHNGKQMAVIVRLVSE